MSSILGSNQREKKLLIFEPDEERRNTLATLFSRYYEYTVVDSENAAVEAASRSAYAVALVTVMDSGCRDKDLLSYLRTVSPRIVTVCMTYENDLAATVAAYKGGAFDVVERDSATHAIELAVKQAFAKYETEYVKASYQKHLEDLVAERTVELDRAQEDIENSCRMTLKALVQALETRDFETAGHSERVVTFSLRLGFEMGLSREGMRDLELGSLLHDVGKIGVPDSILHKPTDLTDHEWTVMRLHPIHGQEILRDIPFLRGAARIVAQHHEKWDGSGYPKGLRGESIDIGARIFAVADAFDAMISERIFRDSRTYSEARYEIERNSGNQFDPMVVEAFKGIPPDDWDVLLERSLLEKKESLPPQMVVASLVYTERELEMVH